MTRYEEIEVLGNEIVVRYNEDGSVSSFMADPANSDYQAYLKSLKHLTEKVTDEANTL